MRRSICRRWIGSAACAARLTGAWVRESLGSLLGLAVDFRRVDFIETHSVQEGILAGRRGTRSQLAASFAPVPQEGKGLSHAIPNPDKCARSRGAMRPRFG